MKRPIALFLVLSLSFVHLSAFAQETFFGTLDEDLVFNNGVLLQGVTSSAEGVGSVALDGAGTLTVASAAGGGFPRITVFGGGSITSTRTFDASASNKTTWSGQFDAPGQSVKPDFFEINDPGAGFSDDYEAVEAFSIGLSNESFSFAPEATMVFPVAQQNGQKLYLANAQTDGTWSVDRNIFCIVSNNLCSLSMGSLDKIALIKERFENCPVQNIANGVVGPTPGCIFSCNGGFELNDTATGCEEAVGVDEFEDQFAENTTAEAPLDEAQFFENAIVAPQKEYEFPPGHFRYRASSEKFNRYLDESGLAGADGDGDNRVDRFTDLGLARLHNTTYISRNPRSAEEQLASQKTSSTAAEKAKDEESFAAYLLQMRNYFGENAQENNYTAFGNQGGSSAVEDVTAAQDEEDDDTEENFLSSGPLLPSTGPGIFITIAVVGFALMLFGARRT